MKKRIIVLSILICSSVLLNGQTTITLVADYDAAIGYDNGLHADNNYGYATQNGAYCIAGTGGGENRNRSLIHFDYSSIPDGVTILSAELNLYAHGVGGSLPGHIGDPNNGLVQRVTETWSYTTVTWNNQPATTTEFQTSLPTSISALDNYLDLDVKEMIEEMIDSDNYGFMLRQEEEVTSRALLFASLDYGDEDKAPTLTITFREESTNDILENDIAEIDYTIYPNPLISNCFSIAGGNIIPRDIYDISGKLVYNYTNQTMISKDTPIEIPTNLVNGIYFFYFETLSGELKKKKLVIDSI